MSGDMIFLCGWLGMFAPMALGSIGSMIGCALPGQTACGAMLDVEGGYGRFIGLSAMPSSQTIYGIVVMFSLQAAATDPNTQALVLTAQNAYGIFAIGGLTGLALLVSAAYQGRCLASAINASKSKPEIFGLSIAPAAIIEGFAVFAFVFALVLSGALPDAATAKLNALQIFTPSENIMAQTENEASMKPGKPANTAPVSAPRRLTKKLG